MDRDTDITPAMTGPGKVSETASKTAGERQDSPCLLSKTDIGNFELDIRRSCKMFFPKDYFADAPWVMLLELYKAHQGGGALTVRAIADIVDQPEEIVRRYADLLAGEGYVRSEASGNAGDGDDVRLTAKGIDHLNRLLDEAAERLSAMLENIRETKQRQPRQPEQDGLFF